MASPYDDVKFYYLLNEESGDRDDIVNSESFDESGSVGYDTGLVYSNAAEFDYGTSGYLVQNPIGSTAVPASDGGDYTLAIWVYAYSYPPNSPPTVPYYRIIYFAIDPDSSPWAKTWVGINSSNEGFFITDGTSPGQNAIAHVDWPGLNQWVFLVCEIDHSEMEIRISVNGGTPVSESFLVNRASPSAYSQISLVSTDNAFDGRIGPICGWTRLLSSEEITELYNGGDGLPYSNGSSIVVITITITEVVTVTVVAQE